MRRGILRLAALAATALLTIGATAPASPGWADPSSRYTVVQPRLDRDSIIHNPGMGWALYAEEFEKPLADANWFWSQVDPYRKSASVLYIRVPWSRMEPTEGHYAWKYDANFKRFLQGARDRGLRLAFDIFVDSQDVHMQATPQFVYDAGAKGYPTASNSALITPYLNDPVFRDKLGRFVKAFGAEFDDPERVDYIDAGGLGWWGEMHNIQGLTAAQLSDTYHWVMDLYRSAFPRVLLPLNFGPNSFSITDQDEQLRRGIVIRRDSLGSKLWFPQADKDSIAGRWPTSLVIGENCYQSFTTRATSCDDYFKPLRDMLVRVVDDAKYLHANYLDLRHPEDVKTWVADNPDLVQDFGVNGGYRIAPAEVRIPTLIGGPTTITASWRNDGVGRLPNDSIQWDHKYRISYALLDMQTHQPVYQVLSNAEPGDWLRGTTYSDSALFAPTGVKPGRYDVAVAIVNRDLGWAPGIRLATVDAPTSTGWNVLGRTTVASAAEAGDLRATTVFSADDGVEIGFGMRTATVRSLQLVGPVTQQQPAVRVESYNGHDWQPISQAKLPSDGRIDLGVAVSASRLRLTGLDDAPLQINDVKVRGTAGEAEPAVNIAPSTVAAVTPIDLGRPDAAVDGDPSTVWRSNGPAAGGQLTFSLAQPAEVGGISLTDDGSVKTVAVDYWNAGAWHRATESSLTWQNGTARLNFAPALTDKVRVTILTTGNGTASIAELGILGQGQTKRNLATLSRASTNTSSAPGTGVQTVRDGDPTTVWTAASDATLPSSVVLDWGELATAGTAVSVDGLKIAARKSSAPSRIDIDAWDGQNWQPMRHGVQLNWAGDTLPINVPLPAARTTRLRVTVTDAPAGPSIGEIEASGWTVPLTDDLIPPPPPKASTTIPTLPGSNPIEAIMDGNTATAWQSTTDMTLPGEIDVDYGRNTSVSSIVLTTRFAQGQAITKFDLERWDGTAWRSVLHDAQLSYTTNDWTEERKEVTFPAVSGSKFRITVTDANQVWGNISISELELK